MARFDYFVIFAEMRTGSNFLETNLNALDGVICHGEAFNPHFIGYPKSQSILGISQAERDADPQSLLQAIRTSPEAMSGFRYFHDHDPRVFDKIVKDPKCAKIVLTRNPVDSYVSWKIAVATGQWKLTDAKARKESTATFDAEEFSTHVNALQSFQVELLNRLQMSGQTAFYVGYDDLQSRDVLNGMAQWLGVDARLESIDKNLKVQNPSSLADKVRNFDQMEQALSGIDQFDLTRTPNFEPRRGPAVPTYVASTAASLLYLPIRGGAEDRVKQWMQNLDRAVTEQSSSKLTQNGLREWMRAHPGHRSFSVLRHPLSRAHDVFCHRILNTGDGSYGAIRSTLKNRYNFVLPGSANDTSYDLAAHRTAFAAFLVFLKSNLNGQTAIRVDADWASQSKTIEGFAEFVLPDRLMRDATVETELAELTETVGIDSLPDLPEVAESGPFALADIYDQKLEKLARAAYPRDYLVFGFGDWVPS